MDNQTAIIRAELPEVAAIIRDECWLEGERRGHTVDPIDVTVQQHVAEVILGGVGRPNVMRNHGSSIDRSRTMAIKQAVPVLRVADVARSMEWYRGTLGFVSDPFPAAPPHEFAILRQGQVELMLRRGSPPVRPNPRQYDWDVYLRREGSRFREVFAAFSAVGVVTRRLEQMPYGLAEFEITDPDGYVICLSQLLEDASDLPTPTT